MFVVKDDDGKNDHVSYKYIYLNYFQFVISYYRMRLFLAVQVRGMAAAGNHRLTN